MYLPTRIDKCSDLHVNGLLFGHGGRNFTKGWVSVLMDKNATYNVEIIHQDWIDFVIPHAFMDTFNATFISILVHLQNWLSSEYSTFQYMVTRGSNTQPFANLIWNVPSTTNTLFFGRWSDNLLSTFAGHVSTCNGNDGYSVKYTWSSLTNNNVNKTKVYAAFSNWYSSDQWKNVSISEKTVSIPEQSPDLYYPKDSSVDTFTTGTIYPFALKVQVQNGSWVSPVGTHFEAYAYVRETLIAVTPIPLQRILKGQQSSLQLYAPDLIAFEGNASAWNISNLQIQWKCTRQAHFSSSNASDLFSDVDILSVFALNESWPVNPCDTNVVDNVQTNALVFQPNATYLKNDTVYEFTLDVQDILGTQSIRSFARYYIVGSNAPMVMIQGNPSTMNWNKPGQIVAVVEPHDDTQSIANITFQWAILNKKDRLLAFLNHSVVTNYDQDQQKIVSTLQLQPYAATSNRWDKWCDINNELPGTDHYITLLAKYKLTIFGHNKLQFFFFLEKGNFLIHVFTYKKKKKKKRNQPNNAHWWSSATTGLHINMPPRKGNCEIAPSHGTALSSVFSIDCYGFADRNRPQTQQTVVTDPLQYLFVLINATDGNEIGLLNTQWSVIPRIEDLTLPAGDYRIRVLAKDVFDAVVCDSVSVHVANMVNTSAVSGQTAVQDAFVIANDTYTNSLRDITNTNFCLVCVFFFLIYIMYIYMYIMYT
ncbi:hypothetical protein RFI_19346 [Reticulomyxa filosa]|uniref:PKD/REJ-like domain-containing protein n=1 Tax=Reticulomyxa filosa TaxID=46433 RepID=X6MVE7_RETFI|nr:hypothetical protein RFI_19346 [Reticulomyxa filosa]|eukprot:ETO17958.1 hypothetical protein RFI_19346 [Reticulomyxa filosa]